MSLRENNGYFLDHCVPKQFCLLFIFLYDGTIRVFTNDSKIVSQV